MKKRLIAFLLVLIMVLGMLPVSALAADGDATRYTYHLIHEFNYVGGTRWDIQATTAAESYQIDVNKGKPTRNGYTFLGWADDADATTAQYHGGDLILLTRDNPTKTIYAVWEKNVAPIEYTVTYYKNDGSANDLFYKTDDWGRPSEQFNIYWGKPTRDGYDFVGWAETRNATEAKYANGGAGGKQSWIKLDGPKVLYAVWQEAGLEPEAPRSPSDCKDQLKKNTIKLVCVGGNHPDKVITFADVSYGSDWSMGDTCRLNFYAKDAALKYSGHAPKNPEERIYVTFKWVNDKTDANGKYLPGEWVMVETTAAVVELVDTGVEAPSQPTTAQLGNIKVTCRTNAEHSSEFPVARCMGTTVGTVTFDSVKKQWYIDTAPMTTQLASRYDSWKGYAEGTHRLVNPDAKLNARFYYDGEKWYTEDTLAIDVCCGETPVKPTALDGSFAIVCKNNKATHPYKADYIATPSQYTISDVQMDDQGYYVTATVTVAPNLVAYNTDTGANHRLVNEQDATLTITFRYDTEVTVDGNRKWKQQGDLPVVEVICKEIEAPTADELKKLEMAVQVKCVVDAAQQHTSAYGLLGEYDKDYFVGEPKKVGDDWLCDISYDPDPYVAEFNKAFPTPKHIQNDEKIVPVTLIWVGGSWQIKTQGRVLVTEVYTVTFDSYGGTPVPPAQEVEYGLTATEPAAPEKTGYTFDGWYLGEAEAPFSFDTTITSDITLTAKWHVTLHNIYAYARLNSYFAPLTADEFDTPITLNDATLSRLGLGSYNSLGYISIGSFDFDAMPLTKDLYFDDDPELAAALAKLAQSIALETGVSEDTAEKIAWTVLYKTVNEEDMAAGYPADDGYQLSGNLNLASVTFRAGAENVENMPAVNYTYDDGAIDFHDFYFAGDTFTLPADPTREGYSFEGWSVKVLPDENDADHLDADGADDAADETLLKAGDTYTITKGGVIFTAQWEARTDTPYTVEHYLENLNGSYALDTTEPLKGTTDTTVTAAAKSYDNFTYDSTVPDTVASGNIAADGSLVLKLFYTRNTYDYTVRHIKQLPDGSYDEANAEVETLSGKFEALAAVTAKDYGEHYPTNDADTKQNIKIEKGLTIDVKYALDEHTLTFETNGGSAINPITVRHGNAVARPADPTKDKYTFIGWYADPEFTEEYDFATVLEADKTIYAKFELTSTPIGDIYVRYDVLHIKQLPDGTYDLANAEVEHLSAKKDSTVTAVIKDYRATHHVNVNRTLSKLTGTAIQPYMGVDGKPVYTILSVYYDLDFHTLTFDTMGGSKIAPETVRHGLTVAKPKDPVNGGYWFDGWYTDKTYRTPYNFATPLTQDTTIYAKWFLIVLPGVTVKKNTPKLNTADHFAYVQGYPDGTVKPAGNITRAETAAILFRLMDEGSRKTYYSTTSGFRDVASGSWYNTYVATLNNAGVITDSSNGYFRPNEAITRAELAAMLAKFSETTGAANYFNDVSAKYWAANAIAICAKLGWINGYPDGTFRPDKNVTRAELMAMINRATGRAPKSADAFLPGMKTWSDNTADKWYYLDVQEATNSHSYTVKGSETWTALTSDPNWSLYE